MLIIIAILKYEEITQIKAAKTKKSHKFNQIFNLRYPKSRYLFVNEYGEKINIHSIPAILIFFQCSFY